MESRKINEFEHKIFICHSPSIDQLNNNLMNNNNFYSENENIYTILMQYLA